jgi:hypothetical protein
VAARLDKVSVKNGQEWSTSEFGTTPQDDGSTRLEFDIAPQRSRSTLTISS